LAFVELRNEEMSTFSNVEVWTSLSRSAVAREFQATVVGALRRATSTPLR
jgi:hypothetical protein